MYNITRMNVRLLNRMAIMEYSQLKGIVPFIYKCEMRKNVEISLPDNFYIHNDHLYTHDQYINGTNELIWKPALYFKNGFGTHIHFSDYLCRKYRIK